MKQMPLLVADVYELAGALRSAGERIAGQIAVLLRPAGGVGDLVIEGGCGEDLGEQRIGIERDTLHDLMERMTAGKFRHMPVVELGKLAGIISIGDVVKTRIAETVSEANSLRDYISATA